MDDEYVVEIIHGPAPDGEWREIEILVDGETQVWKAFVTENDGVWEYAIDFSDESQRVK